MKPKPKFIFDFLHTSLLKLPPEIAHDVGLKCMNLAYKAGINIYEKPKNCYVKIMGINFPNPVGLAAGLDKNGDYIDALSSLGFGFIEIGSVTPKSQPGNLKPRLFRLKKENGIINRMGFNNKGVDHLINNVKNSNFNGILGINIGKNKNTPEDKSIDDYIYCLEKVYEYASYITINISSPNTSGLRNLQFGDSLKIFLEQIKEKQLKLSKSFGSYKPIAVKIAPDIPDDSIKNIADIFCRYNIDGVIATNTTVDRSKVYNSSYAEETGGLSGAPLTQKSTHIIKKLFSILQGKIPIIGVGGIMNPQDAIDKINAGASLIQVYSGLVYKGPSLIQNICNKLSSP